MKTTFSFERVTYNSVKGWIVTMRKNGLFAGRSFGRTRAAAIEAVEKLGIEVDFDDDYDEETNPDGVDTYHAWDCEGDNA